MSQSEFLFNHSNCDSNPGEHHIIWRTHTVHPISKKYTAKIPHVGPCKLTFECNPESEPESVQIIQENAKSETGFSLELRKLQGDYPSGYTRDDFCFFVDHDKYDEATLRLSVAYGKNVRNCRGTLMLYARDTTSSGMLWVFVGSAIILEEQDDEELGELKEEEPADTSDMSFDRWLDDHPDFFNAAAFEILEELRGLTTEDVKQLTVADLKTLGMHVKDVILFRREFLASFAQKS